MDSRDAMMDDRDDHGRDDDRKRNSKRGPEGSQRTESPPRREGAVSVTKPQNKGPRKSTGKARGRHKTGAKLDADAQGAALAFGGDEAQGPQRPGTSGTTEVPGHEEDDDAFPLGGQSADDRRTSAQFEAALPDTSCVHEPWHAVQLMTPMPPQVSVRARFTSHLRSGPIQRLIYADSYISSR